MDKTQQQSFLKLAASGIILIAAALRLSLFYRSLQYDELWSWQYFSGLDIKNILFDLSLPNNHPLNTLAIKAAALISDDIFSIRIFSLICGILLPLPAGFAAGVWCKDKTSGITTAILTAFSAPLIVYSGLARGYILQAFFFVLTAAGFACFSEKFSKKFSIAGFILIITGGIGTILSVPTGIIFLAALLTAILIRYRTVKAHKLIYCALFAGLILSGIYYTKIYHALTAAQKWSIGGNYFSGCGKIIFHTACGSIIALLAAIKFAPAKTLPLLAVPLTVLLSGAITGLGPDRTYIIFAVIFAVICAIAITELFKRNKAHKAAAVILLLIFAAGQIYLIPSYLLPDWEKADTEKSATAITVYQANSSYPLLWNKGEKFVADYHAATNKIYLNEVKVYAPNGVFNGMDNSFGEKQIQTKLKGTPGYDKVLGTYHCYKLELCTEPANENGCYLVIFPSNNTPVTPLANSLRINPHFENMLDNSGKRCGVYFTTKYPDNTAGANIFLIK